MGTMVKSDSPKVISEEATEAVAVRSDGLGLLTPAIVDVPNTPEAAAHRRKSLKAPESCAEDCDAEVMEFVSYDDGNEADSMELPVAVSRVRDFTLAKDSAGLRTKVTLETARVKLDRVKAAREKRPRRSRRRKLENFLSGNVDAGVNLLLSSDLHDQPETLHSKRTLVQRASAKIEVIKNKDLDKSIVKKPTNECSRNAPKSDSIDEHQSQEGAWVRKAKVKLETARKKSIKFNCKRALQAFGIKKNDMRCRSFCEASSSRRGDREDDTDTKVAAVGVKVTFDSVGKKDASVEGKRKASNRKPFRASKRIANTRLRVQQALMHVNPKSELSSPKIKLRRNSKILEEPNIETHSDLSRTREEATTFDEDAESSPVASMEVSSSVELTPPAKKIQETVFDVTPPPGARLSSGIMLVPPVSPYGLIQEHLYQDPWKVLVACMLLNKTGGRQMHKVIWDFFEMCPNAETCVATETKKIGTVIHSLGLQNKRAKTLQRFSQEYLGTTWTNVSQLHGVGEYARDAYAIFCEGRWKEVQPKDVVLNNYWQWLNRTQGLGYGFSQHQ